MIHIQGDITLKPVEKPKGLKKEFEGDRFILAYGEATGHHHLLTMPVPAKVQVFKNKKGETILYIDGVGVITHQEHQTHEVAPGWYRLGNEQEYDYWALESRKVID